VTRSGISARHFAAPDEKSLRPGVNAARKALEMPPASRPTDRPDHRRQLDPGFLRQLPQHGLHRPATSWASRNNGAAFDVQAVCSGFVYALSTADAFIKAGVRQERAGDRHGSVFAHPRFQRPHHLRAVRRRRRRRGVTASEEPGILAKLHADGSHGILCGPANSFDRAVAGEAYLYMDGPAVFKLAVTVLEKVAHEALEKARMTQASRSTG
jgi:3-oxoacyl-[acyl-carrier-protein] synthase-3